MFDTVLVANRGEIACRVIATLRRLGIRSVAVYSDADQKARHVALADVAVRIGGPAVGESYLRGDRILEAAARTNAQAIHPGYGFLSENPDFVTDVERSGLVFIGPSARAIRAMGLKDAAKTLMEQAGVPVVPGYHGGDQDPAILADAADRIGYPVLIKARAGGGGKGMRLVSNPSEFASSLEGARREALSSFGDGAVLVEKFISSPRHIEVQVFGDQHGNAVHLFERDCSLQRRHQKVIEEAPAPGMTTEMRAAMGAAAVQAARAVDYCGAGTVEFIVDGAGGLHPNGFWFMEMNTRLQVEHPVSEAITGLDFVELQLRVAAGHPLPFRQGDLSISGHAVEARLYAEDVANGFLPATGTLGHLVFPVGAEFANGPVRIDSGVAPGDMITPHYDPMIAKIIVHGPDRASALGQMRDALGACHVVGTVTNLDFLSALTQHKGFVAGEIDTSLIERDILQLIDPALMPEALRCLAMVMAAGLVDLPAGHTPWTLLRGWRHWGYQTVKQSLSYGKQTIEAEITIKGATLFLVDGQELDVRRDSDTGFRVTHDGMVFRFTAVRDGAQIVLFDRGRSFVFHLIDPLAGQDTAQLAGDLVMSPMPGTVKRVDVAPGDAVKIGAPLVVLEAMKMEHTLTAPRDGVITDVTIAVGDQISSGMVLVRFHEDK